MMHRVFTAMALLLSVGSILCSAQTIRINAGSKDDYKDDDGNVWLADKAKFRDKRTGGMVWKTDKGIGNTQDGVLYQTERFTKDNVLKYSIPVDKPGDYFVRLYFSENFAEAQGKRVFHVAIEGKHVLTNVDIYKEARGRFRAMTKAVRTVVSGDSIEIDFIKVHQNPKVNAIEITKMPDKASRKIPIHPDITAILDVAKGKEEPLGLKWADSYSIGDRCYCMTTYDHNIDIVQVETDAGWMSVREACKIIGTGPGYKKGYPIYNTIQCGHGPLNDAGDEHVCPGKNRVL